MSIRRLRSLCRRAETLRRLARGSRAGLVAATGASAAGVVSAVAARSVGMTWPMPLALVLPAAGALLGFIWSLAYESRSLADAALALEERYGLKTLLTTALALDVASPPGASAPPPSPMIESILSEAESRARSLAPGSIVEWRLLRPAVFALTSAGLLAAATLYFPTLDLLDRREARQAEDTQRDVRRSEARRLEDLARELEVPVAEAPLSAPVRPDVASELDRLADALRDPHLGRDEAMLRVSDLNQKVKAEREALAAKAPRLSALALKDLRTQEARELALSIMNKDYAAASRQATGLAESLRSGALPAERQAALGGDLTQLATALEGSAGLSGDLQSAGESLQAELPAAGAEHLDDLSDRLEALARASESERALAAAAEALDRARQSLSDPSASGSADGSGPDSGEGSGSQGEGQQGEAGESGSPGQAGKGTGQRGAAGQNTSGEGVDGSPGSQAGEAGAEGSQGTQAGGSGSSGAAGAQSGASGAAGGEGASSAAAGQSGDASSSQAGGQQGSQAGGASGAASSGGQQGGGQQGGGQQGGGQQSGGQQSGGQQSSHNGDPSQQGSGWGETAPEGASAGDNGASGGGQGGQQGGQEGAGGQQGGQGGQQGGQGGQQGGQGGQQGGQGAQQGNGGGSAGAGSTAGGASGGGTAGAGGASSSSGGSAQGAGGSDWGVGSTNLDESGQGGGSRPQPTAGEGRQGAAGRQPWEEKFMSLYRERSIETQNFDAQVKGQYRDGEELGWRSVDGEVERRAPTALQGDLFMETRTREKQSLDHQDIPFEYKDSVRRYFDSIEVPNR